MVTGSCLAVCSEVLAAQCNAPDVIILSVRSCRRKQSSAMTAQSRFLDSAISAHPCLDRPRIDRTDGRASYELDRQHSDRAANSRKLIAARLQQAGNSESSNGRDNRAATLRPASRIVADKIGECQSAEIRIQKYPSGFVFIAWLSRR